MLRHFGLPMSSNNLIVRRYFYEFTALYTYAVRSDKTLFLHSRRFACSLKLCWITCDVKHTCQAVWRRQGQLHHHRDDKERDIAEDGHAVSSANRLRACQNDVSRCFVEHDGNGTYSLSSRDQV